MKSHIPKVRRVRYFTVIDQSATMIKPSLDSIYSATATSYIRELINRRRISVILAAINLCLHRDMFQADSEQWTIALSNADLTKVILSALISKHTTLLKTFLSSSIQQFPNCKLPCRDSQQDPISGRSFGSLLLC